MEWYLKVIRNYATFSGRARRKEFWMFLLFNMIISILLTIVDYLVGTYDVQSGYGLISTIYSLFILIPGLAVTVRRFHDIGKSGWMYFIVLIPLVGIIWFIVLMATGGNKGPNEYGQDPKSNINENDDLLDDTL